MLLYVRMSVCTHVLCVCVCVRARVCVCVCTCMCVHVVRVKPEPMDTEAAHVSMQTALARVFTHSVALILRHSVTY